MLQAWPAKAITPISAILTRRNNLRPWTLLLLLFVCLTADLRHQPIVMRSASSELQETVEELQATVAQLSEQLKEQGAQIQKITAQLELRKPAPQTVLKSQ